MIAASNDESKAVKDVLRAPRRGHNSLPALRPDGRKTPSPASALRSPRAAWGCLYDSPGIIRGAGSFPRQCRNRGGAARCACDGVFVLTLRLRSGSAAAWPDCAGRLLCPRRGAPWLVASRRGAAGRWRHRSRARRFAPRGSRFPVPRSGSLRSRFPVFRP